MDLRCNTFLNHLFIIRIKKAIVFFLLALSSTIAMAQMTMEQTKKEADKLYEEEQYTAAYKYYAQLVSNFPKDVEYNFRLGVCMIFSEPDKKKCIPYLEHATKNPDEAPKDLYFFLGKGYHINYLFDEAIKNYNKFKETASQSLQKKLQVDREIAACTYGKRLLSDLTDLEVKSKKQLNESDYFRSYDLKSIGGKLLVKPDDFKSSIDKKKKEKSIVYLPKNGNTVYYSSYGENTETGKDIYTITKTDDGFKNPKKVEGINTEYDEDYPFLHPNGKTLYFASKGHNSMGGYDIFKSTLDEATNTWGKPVNMEFPINSPDDDYLFVTDSLEQNASFSTGRQSPPSKIDVLKINTVRVPIDMVAVKGTVKKETESQAVNSFISIVNLETNLPMSKVPANDDGSYRLQLPNGGKVLYTVETPGVKTQTGEVVVPHSDKLRPYKQEITYEKGNLKIINYFDEESNDDSYMQFLELIEKKAKLDVSKKPKAPEVLAVVKDTVQKKKNVRPTIIEEEQQAAVATKTTSAVKANPEKAVAQNTVVEKENTESNPEKNIAKNNATEKETTESNPEKIVSQNNSTEKTNTEKSEAINTEKNKAETAQTNSATAINNNETENNNLQNGSNEKISITKNESTNKKAEGKTEAIETNSNKKNNNLTVKPSPITKTPTGELPKAPKTYTFENQENLNNKQIAELAYKEAEETKQEGSQLGRDAKEVLETGTQQLNESIKNIAQANKEYIDAQAITEPNQKDEYTNIAINKKINAQNDSTTAQKIIMYADGLNIDAKKKTEEAALSKQYAKDLLAYENVSEKEQILIEARAEKTAKLKADKTAKTTGKKIVKDVAKADAESNSEPITNSKSSSENASSSNEIKIETSSVLVDKYSEKIVVTNKNDKDQLKQANLELSHYNFELDESIKANKALMNKTKNAEQKKELANEIASLQNIKKQNQKQITANKYQLNTLDQTAKSSSGPANLNALSANTPAEAITKIETLSNQLANNDNENFEFNAYKNPQAQSIKVEADAKINDAVAKQKKLKTELETAARELQGNNAGGKNKEALTAEADSYHEKSLRLEEEAKTKNGDEKTKIINDAKELEEKANGSYLAAASQVQTQNQNEFSTNQENVNNLIKENKNTEAEIAEVQKLQAEAEAFFKGAKELRDEGETKENKSAKLGSLFNAEEKETEAINKQKLALDILKKSNPDFVLKTVSTPSAETASNSDYQTKLTELNKSIEELADIKTESYQKLAQANTLELEELSTKEGANKKDAQAKLEESKNIKSQADSASNKAQKLNLTITAVKKQNEALNLFTSKQNQQAVANNNDEQTNLSNENLSAATVDLNAPELIADTSANQMLGYFSNKPLSIKNQTASKMFQASIDKLKKYDAELQNLDKPQSAENTGNTSNSTNASSANDSKISELKNKSESITRDADALSIQAIEAKKEAETKDGTEKEALVTKANDLEKQALDKNIEAAETLIQSNELESGNNKAKIDAYLNKLKADNNEAYSELFDKNTELLNLATQIQQLRTELNAIENKGARLGALSNAEEKEIELLKKQSDLMNELKAKAPDFNPESNTVAPSAPLTDEEKVAKRKEIIAKQQAELTSLTNAFSLEYESKKNNVSFNLSPEQQTTKANASKLNSESKKLLIQSSQASDEVSKMKLVSLSVKYGAEALNELNKISSQPLAEKSTSKTSTKKTNKKQVPIVEPEPEPTPEPLITKATRVKAADKPINKISKVIRVEGLEVKPVNAYNTNRPIPVDAKISDGLNFRVQIGAFKNQLPNDAFKGLNPLNAETTPNGYFRYTAGNFNKYELANAVKNDLRNLGYGDAFVVGFYNGKRISLTEAIALLAKEGKTINTKAMQTAGITAEANVPEASANTAIQADQVVESKELEKVNGLLYTIQIGVFNKQVTKQQLFNLRPIFTEQLQNGLYRYTAGIYNNADRMLRDKNRVMAIGLKDAFVSAYFNGAKINFGDAKNKQAADSKIKLEKEQAIIFPDGTPTNVENIAAPAVAPFTNGVKNYPAANAQNGVKANQQGICFKVQIGAYSKQIPNDVASKFGAIKNWPVENKMVNQLYLYNIGNFTSAKFAKSLKDEAVNLGINGAFITVYKDAAKLSGSEAAELLKK